ncbi:MAG: DUF2721 domain-containing protein [Smithellaceae bacterium]
MDFTLTTPALLFPAISLLFLAYTNRFIAIASLIRDLYNRNKTAPHPHIEGQIKSLRRRIRLVRNMQVFGVASFFGCVLCMFFLFLGWTLPAKWTFAASLISLLLSLALSLREVQISVDALSLQVHGLGDDESKKKGKVRE